MGWQAMSFSVKGRVSRHNSLQDRFDDAAWAHLVEHLQEICERKEYADLGLCIEANGEQVGR